MNNSDPLIYESVPASSDKTTRLRIPTPEVFKQRCDDYFAACQSENLMVQMTGLSLAIGLKSRASFDAYERMPDFREVAIEARTKVEKFRVDALLKGGKETVGNIFYLKNVHGWKDVQETNVLGGVQTVTVRVPERRPVGAPVDAEAPMVTGSRLDSAKSDPVKPVDPDKKFDKQDLVPVALRDRVLTYREPGSFKKKAIMKSAEAGVSNV